MENHWNWWFLKPLNAPKPTSGPRWGSLQRSTDPLAGGKRARCPPPQEPYPCSRLFGPRASVPWASLESSQLMQTTFTTGNVCPLYSIVRWCCVALFSPSTTVAARRVWRKPFSQSAPADYAPWVSSTSSMDYSLPRLRKKFGECAFFRVLPPETHVPIRLMSWLIQWSFEKKQLKSQSHYFSALFAVIRSFLRYVQFESYNAHYARLPLIGFLGAL